MKNSLIQRLSFLKEITPLSLLDLDKNLLRIKPAPNKWSPLEIMGHLCDSALNNWKRFAEIPFSENPYPIKPYQQDDLVQSNNWNSKTLGHILQLWSSINQQIIFLWEDYDEEILKKEVLLEDGSMHTVSFWMKDYLEHMEHHLKQILKEIPNEIPDYPWHLHYKNELENFGPGILKILFRSGNASIELYIPKEKDYQTPHEQEELYLIAEGHAVFSRNEEMLEVKTGDVLYVPAHMPHRFESFSKDFKTWVVFW
ncbi:MAG: cupin domain-containing protein [Saprospiraceae bacterium]